MVSFFREQNSRQESGDNIWRTTLINNLSSLSALPTKVLEEATKQARLFYRDTMNGSDATCILARLELLSEHHTWLCSTPDASTQHEKLMKFQTLYEAAANLRSAAVPVPIESTFVDHLRKHLLCDCPGLQLVMKKNLVHPHHQVNFRRTFADVYLNFRGSQLSGVEPARYVNRVRRPRKGFVPPPPPPSFPQPPTSGDVKVLHYDSETDVDDDPVDRKVTIASKATATAAITTTTTVTSVSSVSVSTTQVYGATVSKSVDNRRRSVDSGSDSDSDSSSSSDSGSDSGSDSDSSSSSDSGSDSDSSSSSDSDSE